MYFWICLNFRRAKLIECDIWAGYPSENTILRRRFPEESCYAEGLPGNKCGTFVEYSSEEIPRRIMLRKGSYITETNVRKFGEPDIDSPQNHALRNLVTKLSLYWGEYERKYVFFKARPRGISIGHHIRHRAV